MIVSAGESQGRHGRSQAEPPLFVWDRTHPSMGHSLVPWACHAPILRNGSFIREMNGDDQDDGVAPEDAEYNLR